MGSCVVPAQKPDAGEFAECAPKLTVMTFNVQQYQSFPADEAAGAQRLREITELGAAPPDLICVQEGREDEDDHLGRLCEVFGYRKLQSSAWARLPFDPSALITNQLYLRRESAWEAVDHGAELISSKMLLKHHAYNFKPCHLPLRTVVWAKLKPKSRALEDGPAVFVLNAHISGGRYEDPCFLQRLAEERRQQPRRVIDVFDREAGPRDVGILVGDFNAPAGDADGSLRSYFSAGIRPTETVVADIRGQGGMDEELVFARFKEYMTAPFAAMKDRGWTLVYDESKVGPTSKYGHLVDHMAVNDTSKAQVHHIERIITCQSPGDSTDLFITDHNAVKVTFDLSSLLAEPSWHSGGAPREPGAGEQIAEWAKKRTERKAQREKLTAAALDASSQPGGGLQYQVVLRQAEGHPTVRVFREPRPGAAAVGEVPSGEFARCSEHRGHFYRVCWRTLDGWVAEKNIRTAPLAAAAEVAAPDASKTPQKSIHYQVVIRQAEGHPSVRVLAKPEPGGAAVGEIPSGNMAECCDHHGDFVHVRWQQLDGWVGLKNTCVAPAGAAK